MAVDVPPSIPECIFLEENSGIKIYGLKKTLLFCYEPKIKIISVGTENDLETRNIILMGATGAGKTRLIDALVNHIFDVKFEDNYRYILKDEIGNNQKSKAESQTEYVVGYLIYTRPGSSRTHNYLIIDTPGFKDSRGQQREEEVVQQIRTFLQDVDGVDELHSIGFVVNGTTTRIQDQFKEVVGNFCEVFGENAKEIIRIFISFAHMKKPPVLDVLDCSCLKEYQRYKFDNVSLRTCNQPNEEYSEDEIAVSKLFWNSTAKVYDYVLNELDGAKAVSLGMTRETLNEIKHLHESIDRMKVRGESYLNVMLDFKMLEEECTNHQSVMSINENWKGTVKVKVRRRLRHLDWFARLRIHAHNCEKCIQTCKFPCDHLLKNECPQICPTCSCPMGFHVKSDDVITHDLKDQEVTYEDKKAAYEGAKEKEAIVQEQMSAKSELSEEWKRKIQEAVHEVKEHTQKINECSLRKDPFSPLEFIEQTLTHIKMESLEDTNSLEQQGHIIPILEDLKDHLRTLI